jgi:hypothetical protein
MLSDFDLIVDGNIGALMRTSESAAYVGISNSNRAQRGKLNTRERTFFTTADAVCAIEALCCARIRSSTSLRGIAH